MTLDDIRLRDAAEFAPGTPEASARTARAIEDLLAEVDRLSAENEWMKANQPGDLQQMYAEATQAERARILAAIEALLTLRCSCHICNALATLDRAAVVAAIEGDPLPDPGFLDV